MYDAGELPAILPKTVIKAFLTCSFQTPTEQDKDRLVPFF
jgi:hypothetical protein